MEINWLYISGLLALFCLGIYQYKNSKYSKKKSYILQRIERNKNITNQYLTKLELLLAKHQLNNLNLFDNDEQNYQNYLVEVKQFYQTEFSPEILNKLKRNAISTDEKKILSKKILMQSEFLYQLQTRIQQIINKLGDAA